MIEPIYSRPLGNYRFNVYIEKPPFAVRYVRQVHGNDIVEDRDARPTKPADGIYSHDLNDPLAVQTADCMPVAVIGSKGIALLHIGWRGLKDRIVKNPSLEDIAPHTFFIGPHISNRAFEITDEFREHFPGSPHFHYYAGRATFSLADELGDHIMDKFPTATVEQSGICSYNEVRFHSFRRNGTPNRNWNVLRLLTNA